MGNVKDRFDVSISSETKLKEKNILTFEFKMISDVNCRIKPEVCTVYDIDGMKYEATGAQISSDDFILGKNSKFFTELKRVNVTLSKNFKSRIGCSLSFTVVDVDEKQKMNLCFLKRSTTKWNFAGIEPLPYEEPKIELEVEKTEEAFAQDEDIAVVSPVAATTASAETSVQQTVQPSDTQVVQQLTKPVTQEAQIAASVQQSVVTQSVEPTNQRVSAAEESQPVQEETAAPAKSSYVPSFARRYSTNYGTSSVAPIVRPVKKAAPKATETPVTSVETPVQAVIAAEPVVAQKDLKTPVEAEVAATAEPDVVKTTGFSIQEVQRTAFVQETEVTEMKQTAAVPKTVQTVVTDEIPTDTDEELQVSYPQIPEADAGIDYSNYRRKDSIELFKQKMNSDEQQMYLGMTMGALFDKYDLENQRLETFLTIFQDRYKIADPTINKEALRVQVEDEIRAKYKEELRAELKEEIKKELEEERIAEAKKAEEEKSTSILDIEEDEDDVFGLEFYDIDPERVEEYLNAIIDYDEDMANQIGLALDQTRITVEEERGIYTATLYSEASYTKETYVLVRCPVVKVIFYDKKGNIANMAMHSVSRIYTGQDIIQMKLKSAKFPFWQNISKLKIMVTL